MILYKILFQSLYNVFYVSEYKILFEIFDKMKFLCHEDFFIIYILYFSHYLNI